MNKSMGVPENISELKEKDIPTIIKRAIHEANPTYPVPTIWEEKKFRKVLSRLSI